ncbi:MAG: hypothetical protein VX399_01015 [SAR324 cluster bacterium]|nr:hypothetical protein [SAR324 cluster bacterium]
MVAGLTLVLSPAEVVPIAFLLVIAASLHMIPLVLKDLVWHSCCGWTAGYCSQRRSAFIC